MKVFYTKEVALDNLAAMLNAIEGRGDHFAALVDGSGTRNGNVLVVYYSEADRPKAEAKAPSGKDRAAASEAAHKVRD